MTRSQPRYRPRRRASRHRNSGPALVAVLISSIAIVAAVWFGTGADISPPVAPAPPVEATDAEPVSHVTFGAHQQASQSCDTCHGENSAEPIACNNCHRGVCGKTAKTAADCVKCHETGVTDDWVP